LLWIWAIALLPMAGSVAYVLVEVLARPVWPPRHGRAVRGVRKALDPEQDLRRFENEARMTGDVASRQRYADELVRQGGRRRRSRSTGRRSPDCMSRIRTCCSAWRAAQFASAFATHARRSMR
jgi:hypothetical protein